MALQFVDFIKELASGLGWKERVYHVKGPASYTANGEAFSALDAGLQTLYSGAVSAGVNASGVATHTAYIAIANPGRGVSSAKLVVCALSDGAQVAGATDLSGVSFQISFKGTS